MSIAETNRKQLESIGDYVTRANVDWFAVFPEKLTELDQAAAEHGRECHLVVYRTRSENERDHHVIPISKLSEIFVDEALTHSNVNGTIRWNTTLKNNVIRVSHNEHSVDVSEYFGIPLAIEVDKTSGFSSLSHSVDFEPPPTQRIVSTVYRILRDTDLAKQLKKDYNYCCQLCGNTIVFPDGSRYAEAHHVRPLGGKHGGPDCVENLLVLCPNHHAMCDYGAIKLDLAGLRVINGHDIAQRFIDYHNNNVYRAPNEVG